MIDIEETVNGMRVETFLADMKTVSVIDTQPRKTFKECHVIDVRLIGVIKYDRLWNDIEETVSIEEKIARIDKQVELLRKKRELIFLKQLTSIEKNKELEKVEREIIYWLNLRKDLSSPDFSALKEWEYTRKLIKNNKFNNITREKYYNYPDIEE